VTREVLLNDALSGEKALQREEIDMRARVIIGGCLVVASAVIAVPAMAAPSAGPVAAACVVVNAPGGAHLQVGYAPNGPSDCTVLP
jgi:hypothetical protein